MITGAGSGVGAPAGAPGGAPTQPNAAGPNIWEPPQGDAWGANR